MKIRLFISKYFKKQRIFRFNVKVFFLNLLRFNNSPFMPYFTLIISVRVVFERYVFLKVAL